MVKSWRSWRFCPTWLYSKLKFLNFRKNNETQQMNLYAYKRLLVLLTIKQKKKFKNIQPHWFFGLRVKISFFRLKITIFIFGLSNHYFCILHPKIHIHMQFHVINFVRTAVIDEKRLMPKLPNKSVRELKNGFFENRLELRRKISGFY